MNKDRHKIDGKTKNKEKNQNNQEKIKTNPHEMQKNT